VLTGLGAKGEDLTVEQFVVLAEQFVLLLVALPRFEPE
jgi:hypothetical protein